MAEDEFVDHYELLGLASTASAGDIQKAYRKLARKYHPDKYKGDKAHAEQLFMKIKASVDVLNDAEKRKEFDARIAARVAREKKHAAMDAERRSLKEELERREREAAEAMSRAKAARQAGGAHGAVTHAERKRRELERIRAENERLRERLERDRVRKRTASAAAAAAATAATAQAQAAEAEVAAMGAACTSFYGVRFVDRGGRGYAEFTQAVFAELQELAQAEKRRRVGGVC